MNSKPFTFISGIRHTSLEVRRGAFERIYQKSRIIGKYDTAEFSDFKKDWKVNYIDLIRKYIYINLNIN